MTTAGPCVICPLVCEHLQGKGTAPPPSTEPVCTTSAVPAGSVTPVPLPNLPLHSALGTWTSPPGSQHPGQCLAHEQAGQPEGSVPRPRSPLSTVGAEEAQKEFLAQQGPDKEQPCQGPRLVLGPWGPQARVPPKVAVAPGSAGGGLVMARRGCTWLMDLRRCGFSPTAEGMDSDATSRSSHSIRTKNAFQACWQWSRDRSCQRRPAWCPSFLKGNSATSDQNETCAGLWSSFS